MKRIVSQNPLPQQPCPTEATVYIRNADLLSPKIRLKDSCPIAVFNDLFTDGLPVTWVASDQGETPPIRNCAECNLLACIALHFQGANVSNLLAPISIACIEIEEVEA